MLDPQPEIAQPIVTTRVARTSLRGFHGRSEMAPFEFINPVSQLYHRKLAILCLTCTIFAHLCILMVERGDRREGEPVRTRSELKLYRARTVSWHIEPRFGSLR